MKPTFILSSGKVFVVIFLGLVLLTSYFIGFNYFNSIDQAKTIEMSKLQAVSNALVSGIDPFELESIMLSNPNKDQIQIVNQPELYQKYHSILKKCFENNHLESPIYTVHKNNSTGGYEFGLTSNESPYFRHDYPEFPEEFHDLYHNGGQLEEYETIKGKWLSVISPIRTPDGRVIGALEMDMPFNEFLLSSRASLVSNAMYSVVFYLLIGLVVFRFIAKVIAVEKKQNEFEYEKSKMASYRQREINSSINYARRIQKALWPDNKKLKNDFSDFFIINLPKDTVSGDFYWHHKVKGTEKYILIHADCTGHGVPGAMMSVLGNTIFNEIVVNYGITRPNEILNLTNKKLIALLQQEKEENLDDGMAVSIALLDRENLTLQFAGANQNSLIVRNRQTIDLKGDKYPVGGAHYDPNRTYKCQTVLLEPEDIMYSFSDGFRDQFGGPKNKKFLSANFYEMLLENSRKSMEVQKEVILSVFNNWRGECEQIDDVSIVGLKV